MFKGIALLLSISLVVISLSGCAAMLGAVVGGAGTALWLSGKLSDEINAPYDRTVDATKKALASLKMDIKKETKADDVTQIISEYTDGSKVWVDIRPLTEASTKIEIRVGAKGNKGASTRILDRIKKYI